MSHNQKHYRRKITSKASESCKKIDILFKQKSLEALENPSYPTTSTTTSQDSKESTEVVPSSSSHDSDKRKAVSCEPKSCSTSTDSDSDTESDIVRSKKRCVLVPDSRLFDTTRYENTYKWLYHSAAKEGYCCKYCEFMYSSTITDDTTAYISRGVHLGTRPTRKLKTHDQSEKHLKATERYLSKSLSAGTQKISPMLEKQIDNKKILNKNYLETLFCTSYFMLRKRWALTDNLEDFMKNFLASDIQNEMVKQYVQENPKLTYTSPLSIQDIIKSIAFAFEDDTLKAIRDAKCYALMADESTDEANREQFAVFIKFLKGKQVTDAFMGVIRVVSTDAASLMEAIERFLQGKGIDIKKAIFVGFDGCNVMSGVNKGLQRRFRHVVPFQLYINCRNHRLALCVSHLVKQYPVLADLDAVMIAIWKLFKFSAQRFAVFMEVQEAYNMTKLTFLRAAATRWLSHGRACSRLLDRFEPIIDAVDSILGKSRSPEVVGLREMLLNKHTVAAAACQCDMLKPVVIFCDYLQGDVHFSRVNEKVRSLIDELEHLNTRFTQVGNGVLLHDDDELYFSKLPMLWDLIDERREYARRLRDERPITIQQFAEEVAMPMVHSLIQELQDAFHCSPALGAFSVFDMRHVPSDPLELNSIKHVADHYGEMKEDTFMGHHVVSHPEFPADSIRREFNAFKHQMFIMKCLYSHCL
ncbi:uncharacterized protein LOC128553096 isoform X2 [Mercenaria mercenaria]|uniref:uncharacterized protein LOC128553096 isoform X2 n=1 Tax=Mercenaria mercenaria TaxID=6596 RepID=UPI00234E9F24|nr:uncharacterized protein LOC128553096 isoform X2 [Mercenaria mercenaria]